MNNIIDVNKIETYPQELVNYFKLLKNNNISKLEYDNLDKIIDIISNFQIKCYHINRVYDIKTIKKYGILRPLISDSDVFNISKKCKEVILKPVKDMSSSQKYNEISMKYDEQLVKSFKNSSNNDLPIDWYGKYSNICYFIDTIENIMERLDCEYCLVYKYGGELIEDLLLQDDEYINIKKIGKPYILEFALSIDEIRGNNRIMDGLYNMFLSNKHFEFESAINMDIKCSRIINIIELKES